MRRFTAFLVAGTAAACLSLSGCSTIESAFGMGVVTFDLDTSPGPSLFDVKGLADICNKPDVTSITNHDDAVLQCAKDEVGMTLTLHGKVLSTVTAPNFPVVVSVGKTGYNDTLDVVCLTGTANCGAVSVGDNVYVVATMETGKLADIKQYPQEVPAMIVQSIDKQ